MYAGSYMKYIYMCMCILCTGNDMQMYVSVDTYINMEVCTYIGNKLCVLDVNMWVCRYICK